MKCTYYFLIFRVIGGTWFWFGPRPIPLLIWPAVRLMLPDARLLDARPPDARLLLARLPSPRLMTFGARFRFIPPDARLLICPDARVLIWPDARPLLDPREARPICVGGLLLS